MEHLGVTNKEDPSGEAGEQIPVKSPLAGVVLEKKITEGGAATPGSPLFVVSDLSSLWALAEIDETALPHVQTGQPVEVRVAAYPTERFAGTISWVADMVNPKTRRVTVRCAVPNPSGRLKPDMYATVALGASDRASGRRRARRAMQEIDGKPALFVETGDRPVRAARRHRRRRARRPGPDSVRGRGWRARGGGRRVPAEVGTPQVDRRRRDDMGFIERVVAGALRQRLFVLLCLAALVATGVAAYRDLPVEAFPDLTNNQVVVVTDAPGLAATEVEQRVSYPIETARDGRARRAAGAVDLQAGAVDRQHRVRRCGAGVLRAAAGRRTPDRGARPHPRRPRAGARPGGDRVRRDLPVPGRRRRRRRDGEEDAARLGHPHAAAVGARRERDQLVGRADAAVPGGGRPAAARTASA